MARQSRKLDHLKYSLLFDDGPITNGFGDFSLVHNCLPDLAWQNISLNTAVGGLMLHHPLIINAITGGAEDVIQINELFAALALHTNSAMAVGSQYAGIEDAAVEKTYAVVRKINTDGIIFANLGAHVTAEQAKQAIDMVEADAIQIHLNAAQEITMSEGDRNFFGYFRNIADIVNKVNVPVIVKEVGCGIAREEAQALSLIGVKAIDVGGSGGTNFLAIEAARSRTKLSADYLGWGIPTAVSAVEVSEVLPEDMDLIVSGGIRTPLEAVKALVTGGSAVALAAPFIRLLREKGIDHTVKWIKNFLEELERYMLLLGVGQVKALSSAPLVITGHSAEWLTARGIDIKKYAARKKNC